MNMEPREALGTGHINRLLITDYADKGVRHLLRLEIDIELEELELATIRTELEAAKKATAEGKQTIGKDDAREKFVHRMINELFSGRPALKPHVDTASVEGRAMAFIAAAFGLTLK